MYTLTCLSCRIFNYLILRYIFKRKPKKDEVHIKNHEVINKPRSNHNVSFKSHINEKKQDAGINRSSSKIQFESNDILDDYKK